MGEIQQQQKQLGINNKEPLPLAAVRCLKCWRTQEFNTVDEVAYFAVYDNKCLYCGSKMIQLYLGKKLKGGDALEMAKKKAKKNPKAAPEKKASKKKGKRGAGSKYDDSVKTKAVELGKQGKTITQIVDKLNGPKHKAVKRYLEAAGVSVKDK